jgi:hypothetical protein
MPKITAPSIGVTDSGLAYVEVPAGWDETLTEADCDALLMSEGFRPCTPDESERYRAFLHPDLDE